MRYANELELLEELVEEMVEDNNNILHQ